MTFMITKAHRLYGYSATLLLPYITSIIIQLETADNKFC